MATLQCEIVTPERKVFSCDASFVVLPGADGEMGVLPQHAPTVTTLRGGSARVTEDGSSKPTAFAVAGGYAQIDGKHVIILADRACALSEVDRKAVQSTLTELNGRLGSMSEKDGSYAFTQAEIKWNELLLALSE